MLLMSAVAPFFSTWEEGHDAFSTDVKNANTPSKSQAILEETLMTVHC